MVREIALLASALSLASAPASAQAPPKPAPDLYLDMTLAALNAPVTLAARFKPDPHTLDVAAGGPVSAATAVADACWGNFSAAPTLLLTYEGSGPLAIWAEGQSDLALVVVTPTGDWFCDDDSGVDDFPAIRWDSAIRGLYHVWVGTFRQSPATGTLKISTSVDPIDPTPDVPPILKLPAG